MRVTKSKEKQMESTEREREKKKGKFYDQGSTKQILNEIAVPTATFDLVDHDIIPPSCDTLAVSC